MRARFFCQSGMVRSGLAGLLGLMFAGGLNAWQRQQTTPGNPIEAAAAQEVRLSDRREDYVSDASHWLATWQVRETQHTPSQMVEAAKTLIASLDDSLRDRLLHKLDSGERFNWTNLPAFGNPDGLPLGALNQEQMNAACQLMGTLLSPQGYRKMREIMLADDQLLTRGQPRDGFGTECYRIVIFGQPSTTAAWAFQLDGHHIGVNIAVEGNDWCMSPSFIGTQPQYFRIAGQQFRPLTGEIDEAYRFVNSLSDPQRKQAVLSRRRGRILTGPGHDLLVPESKGLPCSQLDESQTTILFRLIARWIDDMPPEHAARRMAEIRGEIDEMYFSWNGETEAGSDISYRIQSPGLIIEYACQDMGGDPQQHLHTMYRNPRNEYGGQVQPPSGGG